MLPTDYQNFIHLSKYSRWRNDLNRRETWEETVQRYIDFFSDYMLENHNLESKDKKDFLKELEKTKNSILNLEVVPSMRALKTAGPALKSHAAASYNCSFITIDHPHSFDEILYLSCCGCGVGFSVEKKYISKLPDIPAEFYPTNTIIDVPDSKIGWASALRELISLLYAGKIPNWDISKVRPYGSILKTFGGRASGPGPLVDLFEFVVKLFKNSAGRKLESIECHDICCKIGLIAESGGTRRAALIGLSDIFDNEIAHAKSGNWWETNSQRSYANNSAVYYTKPELSTFLEEWISLYRSKSGERGILSLWNLSKSGNDRRDWSKVAGVNPCLTGENLIYVADGRGFVSIRELSEIGLDVPVFCYDKNNNIDIRYMRNPRITGYKQPIFKITLENNHIIRVTGNHKLLNKEKQYIQVKDLKPGDSLNICTRFKCSMKDIFSKANSNPQDYFWLNNGFSNNKMEHRIIAPFFYNTIISKGSVVHHKDFNGQNNNFENLQIMTKKDHDYLHSRNMLGDKNPMRRAKLEWDKEKWDNYREKQSLNNTGEKNQNFGGFTNEQLKEHALLLTKKIGYRFSTNDWHNYAKEYNLPLSFSGWRKNNIGDIRGLSLWAANVCGFDKMMIDLDPRLQKSYKKYLEQGYDCFIENSEIFFNKVCESCKQEFITTRPETMRHFSCVAQKNWENPIYREKTIKALKKGWSKKKSKLRKKQIEIYSNLKFKLKREPDKKEWIESCKKENVSFEISRKTSPFRFWKDLEKEAEFYNHKIISIELDGFEDVYNGTVDEFHNFFIGGFLEKQKNGKDKYICINNLQCGEILLRPNSFCNLSEVVVRPEDTFESLKNKIQVATFIGTMQSCLTSFKYLRKIWKKNADEERLLGVSLTGILDNTLLIDPVNGPELLKKLKLESIEVNKYWSQIFKINQSVAITTVKPSGNTSQLVNSGSGIHPRYSLFYIRTVRMDNKDPLTQLMIDQKIPNEPCVLKPQNTTIFSFPIKSPLNSIFRDDYGAIQQLELMKRFKQNWAEHNISITVYVKDSEWIDVASWVYKNFDIIGGVTFLPYDGGTYKQAPYREITEEEYNEFQKLMPINVDWSKISEYENDDRTTSAKELACMSGTSCEL